MPDPQTPQTMPSTLAPPPAADDFTYAQLGDGTTLRFNGTLNPDQLRQKVADYRSRQSTGGVDLPSLQQRTLLQAKAALPVPKAEQDVNNPWDDGGPSNVGQLISQKVGQARDFLGNAAFQNDQSNLRAVSAGKPQPVSQAKQFLIRSTSDVASLGEPSTIAKGAAIAAANSNPFTAIPVDAAIAAHGTYGLAKHGGALADLATTGHANPDEVGAALGAGAELAGGAAGVRGQFSAGRAAAASDVAGQNVAAQRALVPQGSPKAEAFQEDLAGARPYLRGARSLEDLKTNAIPAAQAEIWKPYSQGLAKFGNENVQGPEGPTDYNALEARRQELSAQLQSLNSKDPVTAQTILQQGKTPASLAAEQQATERLLDDRFAREGINSPKIRETWGNTRGIERLISGRNTLTQASEPYGLGKMVSSINPLRLVKNVSAGAQDVLAGRPLWDGKPTDVDIRSGFASGGEKPDFTMPVGNKTPFSPPPTMPQTPPGVDPRFAQEATGTVEGNPSAVGTRGEGGTRRLGPRGLLLAPQTFPALPSSYPSSPARSTVVYSTASPTPLGAQTPFGEVQNVRGDVVPEPIPSAVRWPQTLPAVPQVDAPPTLPPTEGPVRRLTPWDGQPVGGGRENLFPADPPRLVRVRPSPRPALLFGVHDTKK